MTLTFNLRGVTVRPIARERLKRFSRELDERRLGGRYYEAAVRRRALFLLVPEKEDCAMLHYHGLFREPDDSASLFTPASYPEFLTACWREVVPSGTCDVQPLRDVGALRYATKETWLNSNDVICSEEFWGPRTK